MEVNELKVSYNAALERIKNAEVYFDNESICVEDKEKYVPGFVKLIKEMSSIKNQLKALGIKYKYDEGF